MYKAFMRNCLIIPNIVPTVMRSSNRCPENIATAMTHITIDNTRP